MKALTLWQPWASLIAWGEKQYETRGWKTEYRGPLAIHASVRFTMEQKTKCWLPPFAMALVRHAAGPDEVPLGKVLCVVDLVDVVPVQFVRSHLGEKELAFGNYEPDRYAWKLENVRLLTPPIKAVGHQGLWEWTRP